MISNPGDGIIDALIKHNGYIVDAYTPFPVEFARKSGTRGDAPTLVPVKDGGKRVKGQVFVMNMSEKDAPTILYERETKKPTTEPYNDPITYYSTENFKQSIDSKRIIQGMKNFAGLDKVLYPQLEKNIDTLKPEILAGLAIRSTAKCDKRDQKKQSLGQTKQDGVSYLIDAKKCGIITLLSPDYEKEILQITNSCSLEQALDRAIDKKEDMGKIGSDLKKIFE